MSLWLSVILLAIIQGITEFLPVSSSGHMAVLSALLGFEEPDAVSLEIVLHAGSLIAILAVYFDELIKFLRPERLKLIGMLIVATIPAGVAGVLIKHCGIYDRMVGDMLLVGIGFLVTGALLRLTGIKKLAARSESPEATPIEKINLRQAILIGVAQMFAITPGVSRSGSTISAAILSGVERSGAAAFSFLLAIPVIGGATLLELKKLCSRNTGDGIPALILVGGFAVSALVSFGALTLLLKLIRRGKFSYFSWYMLALGAAVVLRQLIAAVR